MILATSQTFMQHCRNQFILKYLFQLSCRVRVGLCFVSCELFNLILIHDHHHVQPRKEWIASRPPHFGEDIAMYFLCFCYYSKCYNVRHHYSEHDFPLQLSARKLSSPLLLARAERKLIITPVFSVNHLNQEN